MTPHYPLRSSGPQPPHFRGITVGRLNQFVADTSERSLHSTLDAHRTDAADVVKLEHWPSPHRERIPFHEAVRQRFAPFHKGSSIGPSWTQHWFRIHVNVPSAFKNEERVVFEFDPSCEGLVFDEEGLPLQAITGQYRLLPSCGHLSSIQRTTTPLLVSTISFLAPAPSLECTGEWHPHNTTTDGWLAGGFGIDRRVDVILETKKRTQFKLYIACSCNGMFGNGLGETNNPPDDKRYFNLASADLVVPRMDAFRLLYDFITIRVRTSSRCLLHRLTALYRTSQHRCPKTLRLGISLSKSETRSATNSARTIFRLSTAVDNSQRRYSEPAGRRKEQRSTMATLRMLRLGPSAIGSLSFFSERVRSTRLTLPSCQSYRHCMVSVFDNKGRLLFCAAS